MELKSWSDASATATLDAGPIEASKPWLAAQALKLSFVRAILHCEIQNHKMNTHSKVQAKLMSKNQNCKHQSDIFDKSNGISLWCEYTKWI